MILASMNTGVQMFEYFTVLTLRRIGAPVARRFPSYSHLVEAGIMTGREQARLEQMDRLVLRNLSEVQKRLQFFRPGQLRRRTGRSGCRYCGRGRSWPG